MNPHIRAATTAGTAYGMKIEIRKNDLPYNRPESIANATNNAIPNMIGTCTNNNNATRETPDQNCGSWNAVT
ncbi:hypothetical protein GCM10025865_14750 [Paraoerskovia sediminicola]|uniref:Uncharacterized protein n=1 Tax=Paraoerskovia sediminicola TaxID=1138587 RepID=A0ABN6XBG3_9CELL|nr:hypothetical protein GCM10025865_14750 [Paraoerskovia sediminicola]